MTQSHGSHEDSRVADEMEPSSQGRSSPSFGIKKMGFLRSRDGLTLENKINVPIIRFC